jgi:hypothetical protein
LDADKAFRERLGLGIPQITQPIDDFACGFVLTIKNHVDLGHWFVPSLIVWI